MTHTPGPWVIIQLPSMAYRIDAKVGPMHVCPAIAHGSADARLIAAAPDLLAALKGLLAHLGPNGYIAGCGKPATDYARSVVARATGHGS